MGAKISSALKTIIPPAMTNMAYTSTFKIALGLQVNLRQRKLCTQGCLQCDDIRCILRLSISVYFNGYW